MAKIPKEMIIQRIKENTELSEEEIKRRIKKKLDQLSGLISEEGAAHIVANELGVKVYEDNDGGDRKIKDIIPGMKSVNVAGKVVRKFDVKTFDKDGRTGKIGSFLLGDETGVIRVVAWNDKADLVDGLVQDSIIKISSGYSRENNRGLKEVHLGDKATIEKDPKGVGEIKSPERERKKLSELGENDDNVEILGTIVSAFAPRFFEVCPECGKRVRMRDEGYACDEHGPVTPTYSYVMNLLIDDGSADVRAVLWRTQVQRLLGLSHEQIVAKKDGTFDESTNDLLGKIVKFVGRTTKNTMFDRIEFVPQLVFTDPDPGEELKRLEKKTVVQEKSKPQESPAAAKPKAKEEKEDIEVLSLEDLEDL